MTDWTDATSYSRGERGTREPDAWEATIEGIRIWVSSGHRYYHGYWIMHCFSLNIETKQLGSVSDMSVAEAQNMAIKTAASAAKTRARSLIRFVRAAEEPHHAE